MNSEDKFKLSRSTSSVDVVLHSVTGRVCVLILLDTIWQNRVGSVRWGGLALWWWWVNSGPLKNNHYFLPRISYALSICKVWSVEKETKENPCLLIVKHLEIISYFHLYIPSLCGSWDHKSILKISMRDGFIPRPREEAKLTSAKNPEIVYFQAWIFFINMALQ